MFQLLDSVRIKVTFVIIRSRKIVDKFFFRNTEKEVKIKKNENRNSKKILTDHYHHRACPNVIPS